LDFGRISGKQRERLAARASRAPELVVIQPLKDTSKCHRCGGTERDIGALAILTSYATGLLRSPG
jgi:hypothetical protein